LTEFKLDGLLEWIYEYYHSDIFESKEEWERERENLEKSRRGVVKDKDRERES